MRPQVGGEEQQPLRPRKRSSADPGPSVLTTATPTSFLLGTEKDIEAYLDESEGRPDASVSSAESRDIGDSTYGVRSISESELMTSGILENQEEMDQEHGNEEIARIMARRRSTIRPLQSRRRDSMGDLSAASAVTTSSTSPGKERGRGYQKDLSDMPLSQPLTPTSHASPGPFSDAPPSPRSSILHSDDDLDTGSQAVLSSDEEEDVAEVHHAESSETSAAGLQLVMPSLMMPSRRPFTDRGKQLGRLKVLLTGAAGAGKTSLIKSIIQTSEDVVHIDSQSPSSSQLSSRKSHKKGSANPTRQISEIYGSTKPYPGWWSQAEESKLFSRRKSGTEEVLERNICFVDTPGYNKTSASVLEEMEATLQYIQTQMSRTISPSAMHDSELLNFLGGAGGTQVDLILFLFQSEPTTVEIEFFEQLSKLAYVIPILSKSDITSDDDRARVSAQILQSLKSNGSRPTQPQRDGISEIYSVCSSPSNDLEHMDASLLMSSGYVEPLQPSQLPALVSTLFDAQHAAFLKHFASRKLVAWRQSSPRSMALSPNPLRTNMFMPTLPRSSSASSGGHNGAPLSPTSAALTYTSSKLLDHKHREERMAQIHLGNWADALRRNLAAERLRFEKIANSEREEWLNNRLDECLFDGKVMGAEEAWQLGGPRPRHRRGYAQGMRRPGTEEHELDPLALMKWRRHFLGALQVVGGVSIVSAIALWFTKSLDVDWDWVDEYGLNRIQELIGHIR